MIRAHYMLHVAQLVCGLLTGMFSGIQPLTLEIPGSSRGRRTLCVIVCTDWQNDGQGPRDLERVHFEPCALSPP
jgi:hypothetical protein